MRRAVPAILVAGLLATAGCCASHDASAADARFGPPPAGPRADLASALLFDAYPGRYHASDFAVRSDWPSTESFYSPGQVIFFSERFVDYQGRGFDESHRTYRRFDTRRVGVGYR